MAHHKKELSTTFNQRQHMETPDYEIFYYSDTKPGDISIHQHEYYEFYYFLGGNVRYQVDNQLYTLSQGDFLLFPPGLSHRPIFMDDSIAYQRLVLWISQDFFDSLLQLSPDFGYAFQAVSTRRQYHFHADHVPGQEIQGRLIDLLEEIHSNNTFHETTAQLMIASFLMHTNRLVYNTFHQISPSYENALYLNLCDYINNHLSDDLSLETLASFFYVSKYHIAHIFKDNMGISLHQYILKKRLQASKNGILSGTPFNQLIYQYGFHDYTSFYRAFKKEFGLSPTDFKEQNHVTGTQHF